MYDFNLHRWGKQKLQKININFAACDSREPNQQETRLLMNFSYCYNLVSIVFPLSLVALQVVNVQFFWHFTFDIGLLEPLIWKVLGLYKKVYEFTPLILHRKQKLQKINIIFAACNSREPNRQETRLLMKRCKVSQKQALLGSLLLR